VTRSVALGDTAALRRVFGAFPTGVTALAAEVNGTPTGIAASSFTSVSLDPPMVSVCVAHSSTTWPTLRTAERLGVSVLGAHQEHAARRLAGPNEERFDTLDWRRTDDGAVVLVGVSAWLETSVVQELPAGDHDIILLRVHDLAVEPHVAPLVFHASRFRALVP
jgi:flavin reductase (DIM6/NTAB) family NADH-FMN oxidoreductase RutF